MESLHPQSNEEKGLSNWVVSRLTEAILNGEFEPGEKLDQELIATKLNVSRTPIREALKVLAAEGFIEIRSFRGAYIPILTTQDVHDVYEIRWVIESEITRQATPSIPDRDLDHLEAILQEGTIAPRGSHAEQHYYDVDLEFHATIARYCQNKLFTEILDKLNNRIVRVRTFAIHQPGTHLNLSQVEHVAILSALRAHDSLEAGRLMELHLKNSASRIIQNMGKINS
jgi:DNA-binding GntR family transcriptional regulator